ncbi:hypothetical protein [Marisediminicola senii]|uniref:hypothetical protein n=1 Tax=Marisediminicola senii TaxID=2711233 RepID=UPI0013EAFDB5|nr:hypothetical protein [Marisediminicola senii]
MNPTWIEHRRLDDGEVVGWMEPVGDGFVAFDLLGRRRTDVVDWMVAEETLDSIGLAFLAEAYALRRDDGSWLRVRIAEVSTTGIRVKKDDWGDMSAPQVYYSVAFPVSEEQLRPLSREEAASIGPF